MIATATSTLNFGEVDNETVRKVPEMLEKWPHGAPFGPFWPRCSDQIYPQALLEHLLEKVL